MKQPCTVVPCLAASTAFRWTGQADDLESPEAPWLITNTLDEIECRISIPAATSRGASRNRGRASLRSGGL